MAKRIVPCRFYFKEGYCVKGKYCVFSHDSQDNTNTNNEGNIRKQSKIVCKFYQSEQGCRHGSNCTFQHIKPTEKANIITNNNYNNNKKAEQNDSKEEISVSHSELSSDAIPVDIEVQRNDKGPYNNDSLWNFQDDQQSNNDGIYFYGACKSTPSVDNEVPVKKFSELFSKAESESLSSQQQQKKTSIQQRSNKICTFYLAGGCRYGDVCRDVHSLNPSDDTQDIELDSNQDERKDIIMVDSETVQESEGNGVPSRISDDSTLLDFEIKAALEAICSICLEPIGSASSACVGELGMLSNCPCTFCLPCIRGWRANPVEIKGGAAGTVIPKSTQHVRLCPLCRRESYFIVPCRRLITDITRKQQVVDSYKQSLALINCKNFTEKGDCPFGTSCFYKHVRANGEEDAPMPVLRKRTGALGQSVGEEEVYSPPMLAAYVSMSAAKDKKHKDLSNLMRKNKKK